MSTNDRNGLSNPTEEDDLSILTEARDLGYEGDDTAEAAAILCAECYDHERRAMPEGVICLLHRWIVRLGDDGTAVTEAFADAGDARRRFVSEEA